MIRKALHAIGKIYDLATGRQWWSGVMLAVFSYAGIALLQMVYIDGLVQAGRPESGIVLAIGGFLALCKVVVPLVFLIGSVISARRKLRPVDPEQPARSGGADIIKLPLPEQPRHHIRRKLSDLLSANVKPDEDAEVSAALQPELSFRPSPPAAPSLKVVPAPPNRMPQTCPGCGLEIGSPAVPLAASMSSRTTCFLYPQCREDDAATAGSPPRR